MKARREAEAIYVAETKTTMGRFAMAATCRGLCAVVPLRGRRGAPARDPVLRSALARQGFDPALAVAHRPGVSPGAMALRRAAAALAAYAAGKRTAYRGPLDARGTPFQRAVWKRLIRIPHGSVLSYGTLAKEVGLPGGARAVGAAVGANPVGILVPCHRVLGARRELTGYGDGLPMKRRLLAHEGWVVAGPPGRRARASARRRGA